MRQGKAQMEEQNQKQVQGLQDQIKQLKKDIESALKMSSESMNEKEKELSDQLEQKTRDMDKL